MAASRITDLLLQSTFIFTFIMHFFNFTIKSWVNTELAVAAGIIDIYHPLLERALMALSQIYLFKSRLLLLLLFSIFAKVVSGPALLAPGCREWFWVVEAFGKKQNGLAGKPTGWWGNHATRRVQKGIPRSRQLP